MAIEDILQVKETVRGNPMGDPHAINQMEFLRFQEQMGLGQGEVVGKLIQMFMEAPSEFTAKFGVESADAIRELMEMTTQRELEKQGNVFRDNSAEIIGKNISMNLPENSAIGTLQTDQAAKAEQMIEFMKKQLQFKEDFNPADYKEGYLMLMNNLYPDTDREIHEQEYDNWFKGGEGSEYYEDRKNRLLKLLSNMPGGGAGYESAEEHWKKDKKEKNFLVDIMKDIIQGGMDTGSGIINAIMDEAKQLYREHTEKSPDYDPEFYDHEGPPLDNEGKPLPGWELREDGWNYSPPQP